MNIKAWAAKKGTKAAPPVPPEVDEEEHEVDEPEEDDEDDEEVEEGGAQPTAAAGKGPAALAAFIKRKRGAK